MVSPGPRRTRAPLMLEVIRGPMVESIHNIVAVVVDEHGSIHKSWGDPNYAVYPRSVIKPLQVLPFLASGAFEKLGSNLEHVALGSASHRGEEVHLAVLKKWAKEIEVTENDLACGPVNGTRFKHNCSGKHMAALSVCRTRGYPIKDYYLFEHPVQQEIRRGLSLLTGTSQEKLPHGIDGCGFPTIAVPLMNLASAFLPFVNPLKKEIPQSSVDTIYQALTRHPDLYSGSDEITKTIIQMTEGKILLKPGAEGTMVLWLPEKKLTIAVKALDGAYRAAVVASLSLLFELKTLTPQQFNSLMEHPSIAAINSRGELVGAYKIHSPSTKEI